MMLASCESHKERNYCMICIHRYNEKVPVYILLLKIKLLFPFFKQTQQAHQSVQLVASLEL